MEIPAPVAEPGVIAYGPPTTLELANPPTLVKVTPVTESPLKRPLTL